jgi:hypothetical protein
MVIPMIYDGALDFSEGLAFVESGDKKIFIDESGKEVIDVSEYDFINESEYECGPMAVSKNRKYGFVDMSAKQLYLFNMTTLSKLMKMLSRCWKTTNGDTLTAKAMLSAYLTSLIRSEGSRKGLLMR